MKKYLLLLFLITSSISFSQTAISKTKFDYVLNLTKKVNDINDAINASVTLEWDFSKINLNSTEVKIEIVPNLDCFNQSGVSQLREPLFLNIDSKEFKSKDFKILKHIDIKAKCFKYRVHITSDTSKETSEWNDYLFFNEL